ncbi:MAG: 50S ribosomal protein L10 [Promethearchaeota archaeon]
MSKQHQISEKKIKEIALLKKYIKEYDIIGLVSMEKINAKAIQNLRKKLRGKVVMRMSKKRIMKRALKESEEEFNKANLSNLIEEIQGISALIFTNMNPISFNKFLEDNSTKGAAKAGDIAPGEIEVTAGDTRIPPGPIISELNSVLHLPTMIKEGTIHIREDTITHEEGDEINLKQALLLGRLGIEPMTVILNFYAAWENGEIISEDILKLDEGKIISDIQSAVTNANSLAIALGIITEETIEPMFLKAIREANVLAIELGLLTPDMVPLYFSKAIQTASYINGLLFGEEDSTEKNPPQEKEKKKKNDKKQKDDEPAGIGALFG